jgi:hypothetical protein
MSLNRFISIAKDELECYQIVTTALLNCYHFKSFIGSTITRGVLKKKTPVKTGVGWK